MNPKQAEHRQLEAESLVEAARERKTDTELMREALKSLQGAALDAHDYVCLPAGVYSPNCQTGACRRARATITKLEQRLLNE